MLTPDATASSRLTGTLVRADDDNGYYSVYDVTDTAGEATRWFAPHGLLAKNGVADKSKQLRRWEKLFGEGAEPYKSAALEDILVGNKRVLCVNEAGMHAVLLQLRSPEKLQLAQGVAAAEHAAHGLGLDLDDGGGSDDDDGGGGSDDDDEAEEGANAPGGGKKLDYRSNPVPQPSRKDLEHTSSYFRYAHRKAREAVRDAAKPGGKYAQLGAPAPDADRVMLNNEQFWETVAEAVPAHDFVVRTRTAIVPVPRDGGLLLQEYRARSGLLEKEDLQRAMSLGRVELEVIFHEDSQKHRGVLHDLGMHALSHGTSQSVVMMVRAASGAYTPYSTLVQARKETGDRSTSEFWEHQQELAVGEQYVFYMDNFFARARHAIHARARLCMHAPDAHARAAQPQHAQRAGGRLP